jgi:uncharacterized protein (DUF736 family)
MRSRIGLRTNGCVALVESLVQRKIDVAIGWSAFRHLASSGIEVVSVADPSIERETTASLRRGAPQAEVAIRCSWSS